MLWFCLFDDPISAAHDEWDSVHGFKRSLPPPIVSRDIENTESLREMVACGVCRDDPMKNNALHMRHTKGWLLAELTPDEQATYIYPTTLRRRYFYLSLL